MREAVEHLTILGGGAAGLSVAYFAGQRSIPLTVFEAAPHVGGNCTTLCRDGFRFDTGPHRLHDNDPEMTREVRRLLGTDLHLVDVPSHIYREGRLVDFPLTPLNLVRFLGLGLCARAGAEILGTRLRGTPAPVSFADAARAAYGATLSNLFLCNYSEKLWGLPCDRLSPAVSGARMRGLDLKTVAREMIARPKAKTRHVDGSFYYPRDGIGMIPQRLAQVAGLENIRTNARVTRLFHDGRRITGIEVNAQERVNVDRVVSTLPLNSLVNALAPTPPGEVCDEARCLRRTLG